MELWIRTSLMTPGTKITMGASVGAGTRAICSSDEKNRAPHHIRESQSHRSMIEDKKIRTICAASKRKHDRMGDLRILLLADTPLM
jgi:hypothetical protein